MALRRMGKMALRRMGKMPMPRKATPAAQYTKTGPALAE